MMSTHKSVYNDLGASLLSQLGGFFFVTLMQLFSKTIISACLFIGVLPLTVDNVLQVCEIEPSILHSCEERLKDVQGRVEVLSVSVHAEGQCGEGTLCACKGVWLLDIPSI